MDGSIDGWMDGSMDGSMDRWLDGSRFGFGGCLCELLGRQHLARLALVEQQALLVGRYSAAELCLERPVNMCVDNCVDMHADMRIDMYVDMCADICIHRSKEMHKDMFCGHLLRYCVDMLQGWGAIRCRLPQCVDILREEEGDS